MASSGQENLAWAWRKARSSVWLGVPSWFLQGEQSEINELDRAAPNHAKECATDSAGQETHFIMEEE